MMMRADMTKRTKRCGGPFRLTSPRPASALEAANH